MKKSILQPADESKNLTEWVPNNVNPDQTVCSVGSDLDLVCSGMSGKYFNDGKSGMLDDAFSFDLHHMIKH